MGTAVGAGWYALGDSAEKFRPANSSSDRCLELYGRNGIQFEDQNAAGTALIYCDRVAVTEAGVAAAGGSLTLGSFIAGVESLGTSYLPPSSLGARFAPGQRDGTAAWAPIRFAGDCPCFGYTAGARAF